jgi:hypothetical protein
MADLIDDIIDFWDKIINNDIVKVKFIKKDGTERIMRATLNFKRIQKEQHPAEFSLPKVLKLVKTSGIVHVFDLDKMEWRSLPFKQVEWLETPTHRFSINLKKRG